MATPASSVRQPAGRQHVQRILVVDDRPTTREILELALQRLGYRAVGATGGKEALTLLSSDSFDLVISDLLMPRMSGLELLGEIRRRYTRTELPVIILTVMEEGDELVAALKGGANDYVTKAINYPVLLARLETQLSVRCKITRSISHLGMRDRWYSSTRRGTSVVRCSRVQARDRRFADPWDKCPHRYGS